MRRREKSPTRFASEWQRNVAPSDLARNIARFDAALWRGKGLNSRVGKIGSVVLGLLYFGFGAYILLGAIGLLDRIPGEGLEWDPSSIYVILLAAAITLFGARILLNRWRAARKGGAAEYRAKHR
jgi:hypothetical protein